MISMQSGFKKDHSCTTALLNVIDDLNMSLNPLILLEYTQVFVKIKHSLLKEVCHRNEFSKNTTQLLENYHSQAVLSEFYKQLYCSKCHFYPDDTQMHIVFRKSEMQPAIKQLLIVSF